MDQQTRKNLTARFDAEIGDEIAARVTEWLGENFADTEKAAVSDAVALRLYQRLADREARLIEKRAAEKLRKAEQAVATLRR